MPEYNQKTLYDIENGYCNNITNMEIMEIRHMLEKLLSIKSAGAWNFDMLITGINTICNTYSQCPA